MVEAISNFVAKRFIKLCYNTGVNSVNLASFHYMHEPKEPKSLEKFKN